MGATTMHITVAGKINDGHYARAAACAAGLLEQEPGIDDLTLLPMLPSDFEAYLSGKRKDLGGVAWDYKASPIVFSDDGYMGTDDDLLAWAELNFRWLDKTAYPLYQRQASLAYKEALRTSGRKYMTMEVAVDGESLGKMMFELYVEAVPKTVAKFLELSKFYADCEIHRIV